MTEMTETVMREQKLRMGLDVGDRHLSPGIVRMASL